MQYQQQLPQPVQRQLPQQAPPAKSRKGLIAALAIVMSALAVVVVMLVLLLTGVIGDFAGAARTGTAGGPEHTGHIGNAEHTGDAPAEQVTRYTFQNVIHDRNYVLQAEDGSPEPVYTVRLIDVGMADDADVPNALSDKLKNLREAQQEKLQNMILGQAQWLYLSRVSEEMSWYEAWTYQQTLHAERADSICVSFCTEEYIYTGGMHPGVLYQGYTLDAQTGEDIGFDEIVKDYVSFADAVEAELRQDRNYQHVADYYAANSEETFAEHLLTWYLTDETGGSLVWTLSADGVHVWFPDYAFGAYAMGRGDILVPFASYPELFHGNRYTDRNIYPRETGSAEVQSTEKKEEIDLEEFCFLEGGFLLGTFDSFAGIYTGEDRTELEFTEYGFFYLHDADGSLQKSGQMRHIIGGFSLYEAAYDYNPDAKYDDNYFADVVPVEEHSFTLNGVTYTYNTERSAAQGYIFGAKERLSLTEEDMEGNWVNPESGDEIRLYAWRGEFEYVTASTGNMLTGSILYNGNPDSPVYELQIWDGYNLADIYFYDGGTTPRMVATFYDDNRPAGVTKEFVKAMG